MKQEDFRLYNKIYNELLDMYGIDLDKYEREDAFMGAIISVEKEGKNFKDAIIHSFDAVHDIDLTEEEYEIALKEVKGRMTK